MPSRWARLLTFARSALAGGAATLVDLGVLGFAVTVLHVPAAVANAPAAIAGAAVQFFGNRSFAFRSSGPLGRQALLFGAVEVVTLLLNVALYQLVVTHVALQAAGALLARVVTTNVVFVLWSYPAWRRIFAPPPRGLVS